MAYIMISYKDGKYDYQGYSTDPKPLLEPSNTGSSLLELDTVTAFIWHVDKWQVL